MNINWLAGFFDGEGCVTICHSKTRPHAYELHVTISQGNRKILDKIKKILGYGDVYTKGETINWKPCHMYDCRNKNAMKFLKRLLPFLMVKQLVTRFGIQFQTGVKRTMGKLVAGKEIRWRHMHYKLISFLNQRRWKATRKNRRGH